MFHTFLILIFGFFSKTNFAISSGNAILSRSRNSKWFLSTMIYDKNHISGGDQKFENWQAPLKAAAASIQPAFLAQIPGNRDEMIFSNFLLNLRTGLLSRLIKRELASRASTSLYFLLLLSFAIIPN